MLVVGAAILHRSENAVHRLRASASLERLLRCCVLLESAMVREGLLESATVMECALHRGRSQQIHLHRGRSQQVSGKPNLRIQQKLHAVCVLSHALLA
jgi:hypothetical protein